MATGDTAGIDGLESRLAGHYLNPSKRIMKRRKKGSPLRTTVDYMLNDLFDVNRYRDELPHCRYVRNVMNQRFPSSKEKARAMTRDEVIDMLRMELMARLAERIHDAHLATTYRVQDRWKYDYIHTRTH